MVAFLLPVLLGMVALVAEYGHSLIVRAENQRVADLAAFAGALAYSTTKSTADMDAAAIRAAALNGVEAPSVAASLVASPRGNGNSGVSVTITTNKGLVLAPIVGVQTSLAIAASAIAEVATNAVPPCIIALDPAQTGITLSGGTAISAPECVVASNATVSVPCGTTLTTTSVTYDSATAPSQPCAGIKAPSGGTLTITKVATPDPLVANAGVLAVAARLAAVASAVAPAAPSPPTGSNIEFAWSAASTQAQAVALGCTAAMSGSVWTLTCPSGGTYNINNLTMGGGITLNFNTGGSAATTYNFSGSITTAGTATFGPATYNIVGGIKTGGGSTTTFGAGTFNIGPGTGTCAASSTFSICHTGTTLTFGGPSKFVVSGGIYNAGSSTLTLGSGTSNSYDIGPGSGGFALSTASKMSFADAAGDNSIFRVVGNVTTSGGTCLKLPAAAQHDIKGYISAAGGVTFGTGVYSVTGYVAFGANGGGSVTCDGAQVGAAGSGVTIAIGGSVLPASGTCSGLALCISSGYSYVSLTAPATGTTAKLVVVGPTGGITAGATLTQGAAGATMSGAVYFPKGPVTANGGASLGNGAGQCLTLIGSRVNLSGGAKLASACISSAGSTTPVALVQ